MAEKNRKDNGYDPKKSNKGGGVSASSKKNADKGRAKASASSSGGKEIFLSILPYVMVVLALVFMLCLIIEMADPGGAGFA